MIRSRHFTRKKVLLIRTVLTLLLNIRTPKFIGWSNFEGKVFNFIKSLIVTIWTFFCYNFELHLLYFWHTIHQILNVFYINVEPGARNFLFKLGNIFELPSVLIYLVSQNGPNSFLLVLYPDYLKGS